MCVFLQAAEKHVTAEETVQQLQNQLQDLQAELNRVRRVPMFLFKLLVIFSEHLYGNWGQCSTQVIIITLDIGLVEQRV